MNDGDLVSKEERNMYPATKKITMAFILCVLVVFLTACANSTAPEAPQSPDPQVDNQDQNVPQQDESKQEILLEIMDQAKQGKVINCHFIAGKTVFEKVEQEWGSADTTDYVAAAKGTYATYQSRGIVFGINKGWQVFEIRKTAQDNELGQIRLSQVKEALGIPDKIMKYPGQDILGYTAGTDFKLEFIFPEAGAGNEDPILDHFNVLYPRGTVNMMADDPGREW
jgi:hypothetical protein